MHGAVFPRLPAQRRAENLSSTMFMNRTTSVSFYPAPDCDFRCANFTCLSQDHVCDGTQDCSDGSDESDRWCGKCLYWQLCLVVV